jgi:ankyrin repeat protein
MNGQDNYNISPYEATSTAQVDIVQLLIDYGADVTAQDGTQTTPLHLAAFSGSAESVQLLIEYGADVNALDQSSKTPLHLASSQVSATTPVLTRKPELISMNSTNTLSKAIYRSPTGR